MPNHNYIFINQSQSSQFRVLEVQRVKEKIPDTTSIERLINFGKTRLIKLNQYLPWFDACTVYEAVLILPYAN